jgi:hypothetical protein
MKSFARDLNHCHDSDQIFKESFLIQLLFIITTIVFARTFNTKFTSNRSMGFLREPDRTIPSSPDFQEQDNSITVIE